jgi:hydrogenase/urease accessory protein HupE
MKEAETMKPSWMPNALVVVASVIMFSGAVTGFVAPSLREAPPFVTSDTAAVAAAIAGNPAAWRWANTLIFTAAILTTLALVPITLRFRGRSLPWAVTGLVAFALAAAFETVGRLITIRVSIWAAPQYPDETAVGMWEVLDRLGLGTVFYILALIAVGLYGIALQRYDTKGWGSTFVGIAVVGVLLEVLGVGIPAYVYLTTATLAIATWKTDQPYQKSRPDVEVA